MSVLCMPAWRRGRVSREVESRGYAWNHMRWWGIGTTKYRAISLPCSVEHNVVHPSMSTCGPSEAEDG